jgi:hypothetical protein
MRDEDSSTRGAICAQSFSRPPAPTIPAVSPSPAHPVRAITSRRLNPSLSNFFSSAINPPQISTSLTRDFISIVRLPTGIPAKRLQAVAIVHLFRNVDSPIVELEFFWHREVS